MLSINLGRVKEDLTCFNSLEIGSHGGCGKRTIDTNTSATATESIWGKGPAPNGPTVAVPGGSIYFISWVEIFTGNIYMALRPGTAALHLYSLASFLDKYYKYVLILHNFDGRFLVDSAV
jgi:hypothetical protein